MTFAAERLIYDYLERVNTLVGPRLHGVSRARYLAEVRGIIEQGRAEHGYDEVGTRRAIRELGDPAQLLARNQLDSAGPSPHPVPSRPAPPEPSSAPPPAHRGESPAGRVRRVQRLPGGPTYPGGPPGTLSEPPGKAVTLAQYLASERARRAVNEGWRGATGAGQHWTSWREGRRPFGTADVIAVGAFFLSWAVCGLGWIAGLVATLRSTMLRWTDKALVFAILVVGLGLAVASGIERAVTHPGGGLDVNFSTVVDAVVTGAVLSSLAAGVAYVLRLAARARGRTRA